MQVLKQSLETFTTNTREKVLVKTITPNKVVKKVKTFLRKVNSTLEEYGSAAAWAIRN